MFRIKICGITNPEDALAAVEAGADAIGLNFFQKSSRYISPENASEIRSTLKDSVTPIGLFVNSTAEEIRQIAKLVGLNVIQLHGDETPDFLAQLNQDFEIIRARRVSSQPLTEVKQDIQACSQQSGAPPVAILLDAATPGQYGGTGKSLAWDELVDWANQLEDTPLILAGGLTPDNVAEAIRVVRPHGVDVASGVESSPGVKDKAKMQEFIARAKAAF